MTVLDVLSTLGGRGPGVAIPVRLVVALTIVFSLFVQPVAEAVTPDRPEQLVVQPASAGLPTQPFLWGAATSSYQAEGGIDCNERTKPCNDYDFFNSDPKIRATVSYNSRLAGPRVNIAPAGIADNAWDPSVYKQDFDYAKALGHNSFRFSLEWGRIEPRQDQWDDAAIHQYQDMVDAMIARGLKPIMTINHFTLPLWILRPANDKKVCDPVRCHPTDGDPDYRKSLRGWENPEVLSQSGASAGTFTLTVIPPGGSPKTTGPIPFNASALRVLAALVALPGVGLGDVEVDGGPLGTGRLYVRFKGQYLNKDVSLTVDGSGLAGGSMGLTSTLDQYLEFVRKVVHEFRDKVDYWLTINEPVGTINLGYVAGIWSPGFLLDGRRAKDVMHNLILAHVDAYDIISSCTNNPDCDNVDADGDGMAKTVGFAHAMHSVAASPPGFLGNAGLNSIAASNYDYFLNDYFVNAVTKGEEDINYLESAGSDQAVNVTIHNDWKHHLDFLGINYYRRSYIAHSDILALSGTGFVGGQPHNNLFGEPEPHTLLNDLGWATYPQGLYELIMRSKTKWNLPVLITENGTPERDDRNRAPFIVAHVREVQRAITNGADIIGYLHWSLMDNWELQEHYHPQAQFGLLHIDRNETDETGNLALHRALTEGALAYQQVIEESRAANPATGAPTQAAIDNAQDKFGAFTRDGGRVIAPTRTHGRLWEGPTTEGQATLYLGSITANQRIVGMIYWHSRREWRNVELLVDMQGGPFLRERHFDDAAGATATRDIRVTYASGAFGFPGGHTLTRILGTGLWRWVSGASPWGTDAFYVSKLEGAYAGKYLSFSSPGASDVPTPVCGAGGCVPQASGTIWKALHPEAHPAPGADLRLDGTGREGERLFDVFLSVTNPTIGNSHATTIAKNSGSFRVFKASNIADVHFRLTGYVAPSGDNTWTGERDSSAVSQLQFLESRGIFIEYPRNPAPVPDVADQYWKENDPTSVMPLGGFVFTPLQTRLGVVIKARISWEAGGRRYTLESGIPHCLLPAVCSGTWTDIGGREAHRVSERFPPAIGDLASRSIEANTSGGATVSGTPPPTLDLDGSALSYTWTGPFGTATGTSPRFFLPLGGHTVCVEVAGTGSSAKRCATYTVIDTLPPMIKCGSADGIWHAADVSIPCTASDPGSGLADPADASFSLSTSVPAGTETANAQTGTRNICDRAGNCATAGPVGGNRIDKKAPTITILQPTATDYVHSAKLTLDYVATDGGSGVKHVTPTLDGNTMLAGHGLQRGQVIKLLTELSLGPHRFVITAGDNVGNGSTRSVTFTIIATPESIKQDVADFLVAGAIRNRGVARSLRAKLDAAAAARARHNCATAANIYSAFINQLNALSGHGVDSAAAAIMMADARYLILHCWAPTGLASRSNVQRSSGRATMLSTSANGAETAPDIQRWHPGQLKGWRRPRHPDEHLAEPPARTRLAEWPRRHGSRRLAKASSPARSSRLHKTCNRTPARCATSPESADRPGQRAVEPPTPARVWPGSDISGGPVREEATRRLPPEQRKPI